MKKSLSLAVVIASVFFAVGCSDNVSPTGTDTGEETLPNVGGTPPPDTALGDNTSGGETPTTGGTGTYDCPQSGCWGSGEGYAHWSQRARVVDASVDQTLEGTSWKLDGLGSMGYVLNGSDSSDLYIGVGFGCISHDCVDCPRTPFDCDEASYTLTFKNSTFETRSWGNTFTGEYRNVSDVQSEKFYALDIRAFDDTTAAEPAELDWRVIFTSVREFAKSRDMLGDVLYLYYNDGKKFLEFRKWAPAGNDGGTGANGSGGQVDAPVTGGGTDNPVTPCLGDGLFKKNCGGDSGQRSDGGETAVNAQYIRTDNFDYDRESPDIAIISSRGSLNSYYEANRRMTWDGYGNVLPDEYFLRSIEKYSDDYFADSSLVIVRLLATSGSIRHKVESVGENGDIVIDRLLPGEGTADIAIWHILIEIGNNSKAEQYRTVIVDVQQSYPRYPLDDTRAAFSGR
ncbi:hypothetical protein R80B4_02767 [Fibrobacteres bacterium R8-0-B4]